ncbi:MAG: hypothetical protein LBQ52_03820 [Helicobacteraceae bacterium]|jgi:hypothetical protein|nr:hypothetical protein [Helicobacteraceae bacterium]
MSANDFRIVYPEWFDELAEFEHKGKGYLEGVIALFDGKEIPFTFYDITRFNQDFEYECAQKGFAYFENLVVLPAITKANINRAVNKIFNAARIPNVNL